jgi:DNA-binding MarR family transcriptional regulator
VSNTALNTVFAHSRSQGTARLVLLSIADRADDHGRAFCGAADLCRRSKADRATVFRAVRSLRQLGELTVLPDKGTRGCNRYEITVNQSQNATSSKTPLVAICNTTSGNLRPKPIRTPNKKQAEPIALPHGEPLAAAWRDFTAYRSEIRCPLTPTAASRIVKQLAAVPEAVAVSAIDKSITNGWRGVFLANGNGTAANNAPKKELRLRL